MSKGAFLPEIQGMRAIAVLLVVIYHSGLSAFPGGYIGVDVFFVISGYLITGLLLKEIRRTETIDIPAFYSRRIRRLLPAAGLVLLVTLACATQLYPPLDLKQLTSSAFATALYFSNLWFAHLSTDYLADATDLNPFLHTWSLSVEEQFYLAWPILMLYAIRFSRQQEAARAVLPALLVLVAASLAGAIYLTGQNQPWAFFSSPTRAWEFGLGALIALLPRESAQPWHPILQGLSMAGLSAITYAAFFFDSRTLFPGMAALLPTLGAAGMITAIHYRIPSPLHHLLNTSPFQYIGNVSYSLYLWHWPVFVFLPLLASDIGYQERTAGILLSLLLAALTYRFVENPVRSGGLAVVSKNKGAFALGLLISFSTAASALTVRQVTISSLQGEAQARYLQAKGDIPSLYSLQGHQGCHATYFETVIPECAFGQPSSPTTIVLFGDSHAVQWFPALRQLATDRGYRLVSLTKTGCPSVSFEPFNKSLSRQYTECSQWQNNALERIRQEEPALVILSNSKRHVGNEAQYRAWSNGLQRTLREISPVATQVVLITDTPWPGFNVPNCLSSADWQGQDPEANCSYSYQDATHNPVADIERQQILAIPNGNWINMNRNICADSECSVINHDFVLFHDAHHLTASYSRSLADALLEALQKQGKSLL